MNKIEEALLKRFEVHRVIFWYDEKEELFDQFQELNSEFFDKIHVKDNEFEIKHIINIQKPKTKFLLYFTGEKPNNEDNWLLDMELAHHVFHSDQQAMFLQEIGLGYHLKDLVTEHLEFFKNKERRTKLKEYIGVGDSYQEIRYKMLAVVFCTDNISLATYIHAHGSAFSEDNNKHELELQRFNLSEFYWGEVSRKYNYQNPTPSIYDFLIEVFNANYSLGKKSEIARESKLLLSLWKDTIQYRDYYRKISDKIAFDIDVEGELNHASIDDIISDDLFKLCDFKIIHFLIQSIVSESILNEKVVQYVKQRENKFWFEDVNFFYQCIVNASELISKIRTHSNTIYATFEQGAEHYTSTLFEIDFLYRKFIYFYRKSNQNKILSELAIKVEKVYSNDWLLTYNNNWQNIIDNLSSWTDDVKISQRSFFNTHVKPVIDKKQRLFVIITDAFRYECGAELSKRLLSENRYDATLDYMVSSMPSYTQLGMASMLPHKNLTIQENSEIVLVDGIPSNGVQGRAKILDSNAGTRATAISADDFMKMNASKDGRDFVKQYDLIYIYHNKIDKIGDDKTTETEVFEAVELEMQFLYELLRKIANMNGNNMLITSDHGFIYQHNELEESDYCISNHKGEIWKENRRFVIGKNLTNDSTTKLFKGSDLALQSDLDILIPKSINRLRIKGAGSRFIHGGATLQEIVIPLIKVNKKRLDTTSQVEIDIIKSTDKITTNILAISFIQTNLVSEQILPRTIQASICSEDGELLSDLFKYNFDIEEGSERQREVKHRFQLSTKASGKFKNKRVKLILEEPIAGTSKCKPYKDYYYTLNISFTNDFDDF